MPAQFGTIRGDAGWISAAAGAKVGIISRWIIEPKRMKPDGRPELEFRCQFSWKNDVLMNMVSRGTIKPRVIVQMRGKNGKVEAIDVVSWQNWRLEGGVLYLSDILHFEGGAVKFRPIAAR